MPGTVLVEPGLLASLKSLAQENRADAARPKAARRLPMDVSMSAAAGAVHMRSPAIIRNRPPTRLGQAGGQIAWNIAGVATSRRLRGAFTRPGAGRRLAAHPAPVSLRPGSVVCAAYRVDWPGEQAWRLPRLARDTLRLDYARIEERTKVNLLIAHYRRQLKHCVAHPLPEGVWLDGLSEAGGKEGVQSIDVLITRAGAGQGPPADAEQEWTIQILSVNLGTPRE